MSADIPTNEPTELRAGNTWKWRREDLATDYPASAWGLTYWFKRQGGTDKFSVAATADGDNFAVTVAASTTNTYVADDYTWVAVVSGGSSEVYEVDRGTLKLLPRYNQDVALDDRTHAKKVLEAIEAVIEGRATKDQEEYTIGSRSLKRTPIADLIKLRQLYRQEVEADQAAERLRNGLGIGSRIQVRF